LVRFSQFDGVSRILLNEKFWKEINMKYRCIPCGYIYDPEIGEEESGTPPGTEFEDLPDDYVCPICFVGKEDFEAIDD